MGLIQFGIVQGQHSSHADVAKKAGSAVGLGNASCDTFLLEKQPANLSNNHHYQQIAWVQGYLVGLDYWNPNAIKAWSNQDLEEWLHSYCQAHAESTLIEGTIAFYAQRGGRRPSASDVERWEPVATDHR